MKWVWCWCLLFACMCLTERSLRSEMWWTEERRKSASHRRDKDDHGLTILWEGRQSHRRAKTGTTTSRNWKEDKDGLLALFDSLDYQAPKAGREVKTVHREPGSTPVWSGRDGLCWRDILTSQGLKATKGLLSLELRACRRCWGLSSVPTPFSPRQGEVPSHPCLPDAAPGKDKAAPALTALPTSDT